MLARTATFDQAIRDGTALLTRVYALNADLSIRDELTGYTLGGQVTLSRSRGGRSLTLEVTSPTGSLVPANVTDVLFPDNLVMVERGLPDEMKNLGIFAVADPETSTSSRSIRLTGDDRWKLGQIAVFPRPRFFDEGTSVATVMRELAILAGMGDYRLRFDDAGRSLAVERTFLPRENILTAMRELALTYALRLRVEPDWTLDLRPVIDPAAQIAVWDFLVDAADNIVTDVTKGLSSSTLFNAAPVAGEGPGQDAVYAEAEVTDPTNPAHRNRIGYRPAPVFSSPLITDVDLALEVSLARLPTLALITANYRVSALAHPCLEDDDVVRLRESYTRSDAVIWLDDVVQPLAMTDAMSMSASELVPLR